MEPNNWIKEGEWFCAIEGLAIFDKVYDFYFEEYDRIPQNKKIGDYNRSIFNIDCSAIMTGIL